MKIFKSITTAATLVISAHGMTAKVDEDMKQSSKTVYNVLKSEKHDHCVKPGLSVDLHYTAEHVNLGATSNVKAVIKTGLTEGVLQVRTKSIKQEKLVFDAKEFEFELSNKGDNIFSISLEATSEDDGEYFITIFTSVEGKGGRVFEIPVKFGVIPEKVLSKNVTKTKSGVAIIVSAAEEEIK